MLSKHVETGWLVDIWIGQNALREHDNHAISMTQMHYDATDRSLSFLLSSDLPYIHIHTYIHQIGAEQRFINVLRGARCKH
jgi:hypothetical protein